MISPSERFYNLLATGGGAFGMKEKGVLGHNNWEMGGMGRVPQGGEL